MAKRVQREDRASAGALCEPFEPDRRPGMDQGGGAVALGERRLCRIEDGAAHAPAVAAAQALSPARLRLVLEHFAAHECP